MIAIKYASNSTLTGATTTTGVAVDSTTDFTSAIDLSGLTPDTQYWYTRVIDGVEQDAAPYPSFKTFPAAGAATSFSFAFGSCTKHSDTIGEDSIFNAVPAAARFFLHLGDTVYADRDPPVAATLADYRTQHRAALAGADVTTQDYKALRARMPVFTTWDDHDITNDFSGGAGDALYAPAKQAFQEYGARANPDSLTAGELYYTFQCGDVGFFMLDGRSFRNSDAATDNSSKTLLGATQKAALKNWLLTNKTALTLKFICSSTPAHGYGANTGGDSWGGVDDGTQAPNGANGFRTERNEIFDYIDANQIPGVVIISGDQHWAGSFKTTYANRARYEFMSTPLNMTNTASYMLTAVARAADAVNGPVFWKLDNTMNVGVVSVDTTVSPATVSFQLYGTGGSLGSSYLTNLTTDDIDANLAPQPAITLAADPGFPASLHVGDTGTFDIVATRKNGATGSLIIAGTPLPDGMTVGSTIDNGDDTFTATVSYDLTTEQDVTASFTATGGSVSATPLAHEFNVQAAASGVATLVQEAPPSGAFTASYSLSLPAAPTAGNLLLLSVFANSSGLVYTPPSGFTAVPGSQTTSRPIALFYKISDGSEQNVSGALSASVAWGAEYSEWHGASNVSSQTGNSVASGTSTPTLGPSLAPPSNATPIFYGVDRNGTTHVASVPSSWDFGLIGNTSPTKYAPTMIYGTSQASAALSVQVTLDGTTATFYQWTAFWIY